MNTTHSDHLPLQIRDGARMACFSDGLCCTDAHALGPISPSEKKAVEQIQSGSVQKHANLRMHVIQTSDDGSCVFLRHTQDKMHRKHSFCSIHAQLGVAHKPSSCRAFPYRVIATNTGLRLVTEHRCPCRTMGDRPLIDERTVRDDLEHDEEGKIVIDGEAPESITLFGSHNVSFQEYEAIEREQIARILDSENVIESLGVLPFPRLITVTWRDVAHLFRAMLDGTSGSIALACFGDALLTMTDDAHPSRPLRERPWRFAFDRAETRSQPQKAHEILRDFAADVLWSMDAILAADITYQTVKRELATRIAVAETLCNRMVRDGFREDRATAEAVSIVELAGQSALWSQLLTQMDVAP